MDRKRVWPLGRIITCMVRGHDLVIEGDRWFDAYCRRCLKTPLWGGWVETNVRGFS